ncbi:MAG TPA: transposase [Candidatus Paceibacterota bacterium]
MPRGPRQFEIGNIYHVVNRGVEKRRIFLKNQDYSRFIFGLEFFNSEESARLWELLAKAGTVPAFGERLDNARSKTKQRIVELLAFALMPNHYHLIMREIMPNGISSFMRKMGGYSTYFNKQYERVGSLFQSRYKAVPIKNDEQLYTTFVYVHTNPVELKEPLWKDFQVRDEKRALAWLEEYRWSSYHDYLGRQMFPETTQREFFLNFYGGEEKCRGAVEEWIKLKARKAKLGGELGPEIME